MKKLSIITTAILGILFQVGCGESESGENTSSTILSGGEASINDRTSNAFSNPAPNLTDDELALHLEGDADFEATFVTAPADINPGLGPLFNNVSCNSCHSRDGRGLPVAGNTGQRSQLLIRVSDPDGVSEIENAPAPVDGIGTQIQDHAIYGYAPEASVDISWEEITGEYPDGTPYSLRKPSFLITLADGSLLPSYILTSPRLPPPVFGGGLLESISEETILTYADEEDKDGDGISGKPNYTWDVTEEKYSIGRFGLKANTPTLLQQTAAAYFNDMGVSNFMFLGDDTSPDVDEDTVRAVVFYLKTLAVPVRINADDEVVQKGEKIFETIQCATCHIPKITTGESSVASLSNQTIHPYTDLLLHDMGDDLADNRPDFDATGSEWKTPALWGIGLTQTVLVGASFLHDGRARTLEEAILWHGGEAQNSKESFMNLSAQDREALITFLESL